MEEGLDEINACHRTLAKHHCIPICTTKSFKQNSFKALTISNFPLHFKTDVLERLIHVTTSGQRVYSALIVIVNLDDLPNIVIKMYNP